MDGTAWIKRVSDLEEYIWPLTGCNHCPNLFIYLSFFLARLKELCWHSYWDTRASEGNFWRRKEKISICIGGGYIVIGLISKKFEEFYGNIDPPACLSSAKSLCRPKRNVRINHNEHSCNMAAIYRGNKSLLKKHIKRKTVQFSYFLWERQTLPTAWALKLQLFALQVESTLASWCWKLSSSPSRFGTENVNECARELSTFYQTVLVNPEEYLWKCHMK